MGFDKLDINHDSKISQDELEGALKDFIGRKNNDALNISGGSGGNSANSGAPPLGMDSNPYSHKNRKPTTSAGSDTGSGSGGGDAKVKVDGKFDNAEKNTKNFIKGLFSSFSAIIATEIGDKTFFIAAVLSMRNDRMAVFGGAICALIVMTVLSYVCYIWLHCLIWERVLCWPSICGYLQFMGKVGIFLHWGEM